MPQHQEFEFQRNVTTESSRYKPLVLYCMEMRGIANLIPSDVQSDPMVA